MRQHGVRFIPMFGRQSYVLDGKHHFYGGVNIEAVGGGWGLVDAEVRIAERLGIEIRYGTGLRKLLQDRKGAITGVQVFGPDGYDEIHGKSVVLACGGFEANPEMRTRYLGPGWELCRVRGTRYNTGDGIRAALDIGAQPFGGWSTCHAVQWDISAPPFGDRVVLDNFQKHSYPIGIVVNLNGERFVDEGADYRNYTYAKYGREVMKQPQRDRRADLRRQDDRHGARRIPHPPGDQGRGEHHRGAGAGAGHRPRRAGAHRAASSTPPASRATTTPRSSTARAPRGIAPPKSNWALPISEPPYSGFVVTCGITFTFGGLRINTSGEVLDVTDRTIPGLYAAGELVGGIFYGNYLGGAGLMSGAVFGRLSGTSAGRFTKG